jgi:hypothetical protein
MTMRVSEFTDNVIIIATTRGPLRCIFYLNSTWKSFTIPSVRTEKEIDNDIQQGIYQAEIAISPKNERRINHGI